MGVAPGDGQAQVDWMTDKMLGLRIFADDNSAMNLSVQDINGGVLVVSQFTLTADTARGRRPSFTTAATPEHARVIYDDLVSSLGQKLVPKSDCKPASLGPICRCR